MSVEAVGAVAPGGAVVVPALEQHAAEPWTVAVVATSEPDDGLRDDLTPQDVSPGLLGFVVIFAAAVACIPLFLSMTRKLRKVDPRREKDTARADDVAGDGGAPGGSAPRDGDGAPDGDDPPGEGDSAGEGRQRS